MYVYKPITTFLPSMTHSVGTFPSVVATSKVFPDALGVVPANQ
jgi:hypothetical protein